MKHPVAHLNYVRTTCYKCEASWGSCHCPDVVEELGFEWNGMLIVNPVVSECGRFFVEPELYYGEAYIEWLLSMEDGV